MSSFTHCHTFRLDPDPQTDAFGLPGNSRTLEAVLTHDMGNELNTAARHLASLRRVYKKSCPVCGTEFEGIAKRVYDSHACQVKAYRRRKKERTAGQ